MNIFRRIGDIVSSNVNHALDRMEDPEKMIDLSIRQLEDSISEMKLLLSEKEADRKNLEKKIAEGEEQVARWADRAALAVEKNLDDMAREAIIEKKRVSTVLELDRDQLAELDALESKLTESLNTANEKLVELKETSVTLKTRAKIAKERLNVNKKANVSETADYQRRLEELKVRIERWESEADIHQTTVRTEAQKATPTFEELERDAEIEKELEALKSSMNNKTEEN